MAPLRSKPDMHRRVLCRKQITVVELTFRGGIDAKRRETFAQRIFWRNGGERQ